jgi:ABC-type branched-subunit amino acid transport system substrate-binding protein
VIVLLPTTDGLTSDAALQVIDYAKDYKYLIVGGDSLENPKIVEDIAENSVVAIPWYPDKNSLNQKFLSQAEKLWGKTTIYWHTALTYDATRVLLTALEKVPSPDRVSLQQAIASPNFIATGVTGKIAFAKNGDRRDHNIYLVHIKKNHKGQIMFIHVKQDK